VEGDAEPRVRDHRGVVAAATLRNSVILQFFTPSHNSVNDKNIILLYYY
jgi:hypothetical protein